jgi:hypothetical protein
MTVASAEAALAKLRDPATWPEWQSEILRAEGPAPLQTGDHVAGDARMLGFTVGGRADLGRVTNEIVEHEVIVGIRMNVRYTIEPAGKGWILTHRLSAELPGGLAGRVLSLFLKRRLRRMQSTLLEDLTTTLSKAPRPEGGAAAASEPTGS